MLKTVLNIILIAYSYLSLFSVLGKLMYESVRKKKCASSKVVVNAWIP